MDVTFLGLDGVGHVGLEIRGFAFVNILITRENKLIQPIMHH